MQSEIRAVLDLQADWTPRSSDPLGESMQLRGVYVVNDIPALIEVQRDEIAARLLIEPQDVEIEGSNATGSFARVPWVRVANRQKSKNARTGWYAVYLFAEDGSEAALSLNQGTQIWDGVGMRSQPLKLISTQSTWARDALAELLPPRPRPRLDSTIQLGSHDKAMAYEAGNVVAYRYPRDAVPDDARLAADLLDMATLLLAVHRAEASGPEASGPEASGPEASGPAPGELAPEIAEAERAVEALAGNPVPPRRGFRMNVKQRKAIELRAMAVAMDYFSGPGVTVRDVSAKQPYDVEVTRDGVRICVEVKGTAGDGEEVLLTRGEVALQRDAHPNNALAVVSGIRLEGPPDAPNAVGGSIEVTTPWAIAYGALTPMSYRYRRTL